MLRLTRDVMHMKMKIILMLSVTTLLIAGCRRSAPPQTAIEVPTAPTTHVDLVQLTAHIRQSVQEIDRNVVVGEKTRDRIQNGLSEQLSEVRVAVEDTNLVVNVHCGDPIYHIKFDVTDGNISDLTVGLTPVCR